MLLCLWYRRPCPNEIASIQRFDEELGKYSRDTVGAIIMGDMNVHNIEWLKHSSCNSNEGKKLEAVCCSHGLTQHVKFPTCDVELPIKYGCKVVPGIRDDDHDGMLTNVNFGIPASTPVRRLVYDYKHADWSRLKTELAAVQLGHSLRQVSSDDVDSSLTNTILRNVDE